MILVKSFFAHNPLRNYSYILTDQSTGNSWVIDPFDASVLSEYIKKNGLVLKGILNTHQHWDHTQGNAELARAFGAPVLKLKSSETIGLDDGYSLETMDTPGHTLDHQVFIWKKAKAPLALFSGDTLFNAGVGNCKGGGDVNLLFDTTRRLINSLPSETALFPGHDYRKRNLEFALSVDPDNQHVAEQLRGLGGIATEELPPVTLGQEKLVNPFLRLGDERLRQNVLRTQKMLSDAARNERELFIRLRTLRDQW